jgi:hypothetical protein
LFIGRQAELATLTRALDRAANGVASTILIGGDADGCNLGLMRTEARPEVNYSSRVTEDAG